MNSIKIPRVFAVLVLTGASALMAQQAQTVQADNLSAFRSASAEADLSTKSVFRGLKRSNEAFEGGVQAELSSISLYGGVYTVQPFASSNNNEVDVYLGTKGRINRSLRYDAGVTFYDYPNKLSGAIRSTFEPYAGVIADISKLPGVSVSGYVYYDIERRGITIEVAASYTVALVKHLDLRLSAFGGYVDAEDITPNRSGPSHGESYYYDGLSADFPYCLNDHVVITVGLNYSNTAKLNNAIEGGDQLWGVGRVTYTF